ncbi:zinc finger protein 239-like isoform X1 [Hylaeus anthracinus]|uniref:zinc finger protein 239-like isoform X1 n=1 Tax=Hylaeus anthracinus TaxID=313031 RepID=UPI0023B8B6F6|nr:zinc finger protein 239-like isoform X1 [Hylaeus anthracinus]
MAEITKRSPASGPRMREVWSLLLSHEEAGGAPEEPTRDRQSLQLRRMRQNIQESHEHSPPQVDPHRCQECQKGFFLKTEYLEHVNVHTRKQLFRCDHCGKTYPYKKNLTAHLKRQHADVLPPEPTKNDARRKHVCKVCLEGFVQKLTLERHLKKQHGLRDKAKHLCDLCGAVLSSKRRLMVHRRAHVNEKVAKCDLCDKEFASRENLTIHRRVHTGEKPHVCSQCGRGFAQRTSLILHLRYHSGERPYQCTDCGKGFISGSFLKKHRKIHEKSQLET